MPVSATHWYIMGVNGWYIMGVNAWYIMGVNPWYIIACKLTSCRSCWCTYRLCHRPEARPGPGTMGGIVLRWAQAQRAADRADEDAGMIATGRPPFH